MTQKRYKTKTMKKLLWLLLLFTGMVKAQIVNIPDLLFKGRLLSADVTNNIALNSAGVAMKIDANNDGEIQNSEALAVYKLYVPPLVDDLTGIASFTNLTSLSVSESNLTTLDVSALTNLVWLDCSWNQITTLNVTGLVNLSQLQCKQNLMTNLNLSTLTSLTQLDCSNNRLTTLDVSTNSLLSYLLCDRNQLASLNVIGLNNIAFLSCNYNNMTNLNVSNLTGLISLACGNNQLTSLNLASLVNLFSLQCDHNLLTSLDLSANTALTSLFCYYNQLTSLDLSNNNLLTSVNCGENRLANLNLNGITNLTSLDCKFQSDNFTITGNALAGLNLLEYEGQTSVVTVNGFPSIGNVRVIPRSIANFTLNLNNIYSGANVEIKPEIATTVTVNAPGQSLLSLNCNDSQITDLIINGFTSIGDLNCVNNKLTNLNIGGNTSITNLSCQFNELATLNLSTVNNLQILNCNNNKLTSLDQINGATLKSLICRNNLLTSLDLNGFTNLITLDCSKEGYPNLGNYITSLNLTALPNLITLNCRGNRLTSLILNGLSSLESIDCSSQGENSNELTTLDLTGLTSLKYLDCSAYLPIFVGNRITNLNVSGLTNLRELRCSGNKIPNLTVTGLTNLTHLTCSRNLLTTLDLTGLTNLIELDYAENQLSTLNLNGLINLKKLDCSANYLTTLNVINLTNLTSLLCMYNQLTTLNISGLVNLKRLWCFQNQIASLDLSDSVELEDINCGINSLTSLDLTGLHKIKDLRFDVNSISTIDLSGLPELRSLVCQSNQITSLDLSNNPLLTDLNYGYNQLPNVNLTNLPLLMSLQCNGNQVTSLDLSLFPNLSTLGCSDNLLTSLDLSNSPALSYLDCYNNQLTTLDINNCSQNFQRLYCQNNQLTSLFIKNGKDELSVEFGNNPNLAYICADESQVDTIQSQLNTMGMTATVCNSYCTFLPGGSFNSLLGKTIFDENNNGCNANDPLHPNIRIDINDGTNTGSAFTNTQGICTFYTTAGSYDIYPNIENASAFNITPATATINFPDSNNNTSTQDFCITANGIHPDLEVVLAPTNAARPGFDADYKIVFKNKGNQTLSGNVHLLFDDTRLDYVSSVGVQPVQAGGSLTWEYYNLMPFESRTIELVLNVNSPTETPAVNNGDILNFTTSITPDANDVLPSDNQFSFTQNVVGSFDPNDIICLEGSTAPTTDIGNYLHYLTRFENTGTFYAEQIVVKILIDPSKYDVSSLQVLGSSHNAKTRITGNLVEFIFEDINLAAIQGDPPVGGHGDVLFKIKTKNDLQVNDMVVQRAGIYFDYNFPIVTNDAQTTFALLNQNIFERDNTIVVSPNPTTNAVNIQSESNIKSLEFYDIQGRILQTLLGNTHRFDISNKANGIYFLKITTEQGSVIAKIIKE